MTGSDADAVVAGSARAPTGTLAASGESVANSSEGTAPDFYIVGHPKCGTTALYEMLRAHPELYMPELKETRFFARELHPRSPPSYPATLPAYLELFEPAEPHQRVGEASPSYLRSHHAAGRIAQLRPDARIIAIFREPASFVRSLHMELVRDHVESEKDLRAALALEAVRSQSHELELHPGLVYSEYVRYVEQLRRYAAVFPAEQIMVLIYDDFRRDNDATIRAVLRFLDVDATIDVRAIEANPTVRVRSVRLYEMFRSLYLGNGATAAAVKWVIKALTPRRLRRRLTDTFRRQVVYGSPDSPDTRLTRELQRRFAPQVVALGEYLQRDLVTLWGYDRLD
jgi:sulfotransferase family protein